MCIMIRSGSIILMVVLLGGVALTATGCGGKDASMIIQAPISVTLSGASVVVSQGGTPVIVRININSASETAIVSVTGLPSGVMETYSASDTNPSGTLTFIASATAPAGNYSLTVNVSSAGQFASTTFTLTVKAR
jgi:hypothetical protein